MRKDVILAINAEELIAHGCGDFTPIYEKFIDLQKRIADCQLLCKRDLRILSASYTVFRSEVGRTAGKLYDSYDQDKYDEIKSFYDTLPVSFEESIIT